ncbi:MAG: selenium cofactor biosynthesis protein YqeC [Acidimicrobiia bacterium]|nr:selenium cofactor biosynthesis protein YqeC [Acidimicrobiia bacterium]
MVEGRMAEPIAIDQLAEALKLGPHELVSLVGGGGKTTALFALGRQLEGTVVLTTTTKMHKGYTDGYPVFLSPNDGELSGALATNRAVLVWRDIDGGKALGVQSELCDRWFGLADYVVVEADGARRKPLTAPGPLEPVVPELTTLLVACVGADAFGRVIADQCHRPMRVAALAGCSPYQRLTPERLTKVLLSERGLQKGRPGAARFAIVLTKISQADVSFAEEVVEIIGDRSEVVVLG